MTLRADDIDEWAENIVDYSLEIEEGDRFRVAFRPAARDLGLAVYEKAVDRGAHVDYDFLDEGFDRAYLNNADEDQLEEPIPDYRIDEAEDVDKRLFIRGPENATELADVPADVQQQAAKRPGKDELREAKRDTTWSLTQYPTPALAQKAGMSTEAYEDFVLDACVKDWYEESRDYLGLKEIVDEGSEVRIIGEDTDLTFSIDGYDGLDRLGLLSDGTANVPGGEVFTTPVKESFEGEIYFDLPTTVGGEMVEGVHLEFGEDGRIVSYEAEDGDELLEQKIETDEGSHYIGEFGIGTNFDIDRTTKDILFDEKIGGTIHLAVGRAYDEAVAPAVGYDDVDNPGMDEDAFQDAVDEARTAIHLGEYDERISAVGNQQRQVMAAVRDVWEDRETELADTKDEQVNDSAVHWDMIKDLREDAELRIDGETVLKDGEFVDLEDL